MTPQSSPRFTGESLDLRMVRYAVAIADELHFGRAASTMMVSQQTLSAQIRRLEMRLGVPLFVRDRRHVELTPAGEVFVERGRRLLAEAEDLLAEVTGTPAPIRIDVLREGYAPSVLTDHLRAQLPDTTFLIFEGGGLSGAVHRLLSGELDLAFGRVRGIRTKLPQSVRRRVVVLERMGVALPEGHPLAARPEVTLEALAEAPMLVCATRESAEWHSWQEEFVSAFGLTVGRRLRGYGLPYPATLATAHGQAVITSANDPGGPGAVVRPLCDPVPLHVLSAVWREGRDAVLAPLVQLMDEYAKAQDWLRLPDEPWWTPPEDRDDLVTSRPADR